MLITRNLIIDTQYFIDRRFDFQHAEIKGLIELVNQDLVAVYMSDITIREVRKKIRDEVGVAHSKLNVSDLRYLSLVPLFKKFKETYPLEKLTGYFENGFDDFLKACKVTVISSDEIKVMTVFENYCSMRPPFNDKKDKKAEFPDAFALAAISNWANKSKSNAYLLSKDNDWKLFADSSFILLTDEKYFYSIQELSSFVDLVIRNEEALKDIIAFADNLIETNKQVIVDHLIPLIQNSGFIAYGDSEVSIFENVILTAEITSIDALQCDRESATYSIELTCSGIFGYDVTDYSEAIWDSEDKVYMGNTDFTIFQKQNFNFSAELEISYDEGLAKNFTIQTVGLPSDFDIDYDDEDAEVITIEKWNTQIPVLVCGVEDGKVTDTGIGSMQFENIKAAQMIFPQLDIYKGSTEFTHGMSARTFTRELRFETWILCKQLSD